MKKIFFLTLLNLVFLNSYSQCLDEYTGWYRILDCTEGDEVDPYDCRAYFYASGDTLYIENWVNFPDYYIQEMDITYGIPSCIDGDTTSFQYCSYTAGGYDDLDYINLRMLLGEDTITMSYDFTVYYYDGSISGPNSNVRKYVIDSALTVNELFIKEISVYPNPSQGKFKLNLKQRLTNYGDLEVYSIDGKRMYKEQNYKIGEWLDLDLMQGIYILHYISGKEHFSSKLKIE